MSSKKRAAIIGFGGMGQRHFQAYTKTDAEVVAIADLYHEKIPEIIPGFSRDHIYKTYDDLLKNEEIDILSVVTNGPTHAGITIAASEAGVKNILCEKPLATNLSDAQRTIDVCKSNGTRLAVNHIRRWSPDYTTLKQIIASGCIGEIRHMYFSCGSTGLGNFAVHFFDTARYLTDSEPAWVVGFLDKTGTKNPRGEQFTDPGGYGIIRMANGVRFYVDTSEDTGVQYSFQIVGTYGRIIIDELNSSWQIRARSKSNKEIPLTRYGTDMDIVPFTCKEKFDIVTLTSRALQELLSGEPLSSTGLDGKKSLEMVIGCHVSDEQDNAKVPFPLAPEFYGKVVSIA
nr:Gfo/Idh/MocA family oxidoreductase [uncultured Methanoregula sp.]